MEDINYKIKDKESILSFLAGKKCVSVESIIAGSGAEKLRVYPIITELMFDGRLKVLKESDKGAPLEVELIG